LPTPPCPSAARHHRAPEGRSQARERQCPSLTDERAEATRRAFPMPLDAESTSARAVRSRAVAHFVDAIADPHYEYKDTARVGQWRGTLAVPIFRRDQVIGAIFVARANPGPFSDKQIKLLQTFADQAVIAIENVRLFKELEARTAELTRSVGELRALGEVGQAISSTLDLQTVLSTIVARATQLSGTDAGVIYEYDEHREVFVPRATAHLEAKILETMLAAPVRKKTRERPDDWRRCKRRFNCRTSWRHRPRVESVTFWCAPGGDLESNPPTMQLHPRWDDSWNAWGIWGRTDRDCDAPHRDHGPRRQRPGREGAEIEAARHEALARHRHDDASERGRG